MEIGCEIPLSTKNCYNQSQYLRDKGMRAQILCSKIPNLQEIEMTNESAKKSFDDLDLKQKLILKLYKAALDDALEPTFSIDDLGDLMSGICGRAAIKAYFQDLYTEGYLSQNNIKKTSITSHLMDTGRDLISTLKDPEKLDEFSNTTKGEYLPKYSEFKDQLLIALAKKTETNGPDFYDLKAVADTHDLKYQKGWIQMAANDFNDHGLIQDAFHIAGGEDSGLSAKLSGHGQEYYEELVGESFSDGSRFTDGTGLTNRENPALTETIDVEGAVPSAGTTPEFSPIDSDSQSIPASDRVVELDHNSEPYKEAVGLLKNLLEEVRKINDFPSENEQDRERRLADLETGLNILNSKRTRVDTLKYAVFGTLVYLAEKFVEQPIGDLATRAWEALKILLGI